MVSSSLKRARTFRRRERWSGITTRLPRSRLNRRQPITRNMEWFMKRVLLIVVTACGLVSARATVFHYAASLNGASESPANTSTPFSR